MKTKEFTTISIFAAIIIVLQILATYINISGFPITLTLVPIIVAGAIYGPKMSTLMGLVFGVIVLVMVIMGADVGGAAMFSVHPLITVIVCLLKGAMCGLCSGLVYKLFKKRNNKIALILSAITTPIINTFTLYLFIIMFFDSSFKVMIGAFVSINFVIELLINALLAPGLLVLINRYKNRYK